MPELIRGPVVTAAGEGQTWNVVGDQITCKVASEQTEETYAVIEELSPPQGGTPLHVHRATDEVFYVVAGEYQVVCGDNKFNAPQGTLSPCRRACLTASAIISAVASRVLVTLIPGGFEKFFEEANGVTDPEQLVEIAKRHDGEFLPPHG